MTVSGTITVTTTATDNIAVTRVDLFVDSIFVASQSSSPYNFSLDTTTLADGYHNLVAKAYDAAGNEGVSTTFVINVLNSGATDLRLTRQLRGTNGSGGELSWGSYTLGHGIYSTGMPYRGINRSGPEDGETWTGWNGQTFFTWPHSSTGGAAAGKTSTTWANELAYYKSKGFNHIRLPFSWERIQNTLNGALDTTYSGNLVSCVSQATAAGFTVLIDCHNYGRYATGAFSSPGVQVGTYTQQAIGDGTLTWSHLADLWTRIANLFLTEDRVQFDIMNEPHDLAMTSTVFFAGVNTVIAAIRATGSKHLVLAPNTRGSDVDHWSSYSPGDIVLGAGNGGPLDSVAALAVTDSADNYAFSMHAYDNTPSSATHYVTLITNVTNWAITNGKRLWLGEMGVDNTSTTFGSAAVGNLLTYMNNNSAVWFGINPWNLPTTQLSDTTYLADMNEMAWYTPYMTANTASLSPGYTSPTNYLFISNQDIDYIASKGFNYVRLGITWEALQPILYGAITTGTYATRMWAIIDYITNTKGMYCMIEPHGGADANFAHYKGIQIGTSPVSAKAFADFWTKIAGDTRMKSNPKTIISLSNEPNAISGSKWWGAAQTAVDAIRDAGFKNLVMVPGFSYTNSATWTTAGAFGGDTDASPKSNAFYAATFTDKLATIDSANYPNGNFCFQVHEYFDTDGGGTTTGIVDSAVGVTRAQVMVDWCTTNTKRCFFGEFGASATNGGAPACVTNFLSYLDGKRVACLGWSWWTYGPPSTWGGYQFTLDPTSSYTVDSPQYALISGFLPAP